MGLLHETNSDIQLHCVHILQVYAFQQSIIVFLFFFHLFSSLSPFLSCYTLAEMNVLTMADLCCFQGLVVSVALFLVFETLVEV